MSAPPLSASAFATKAHLGQLRWGGESYITHPEAVAGLVRHLGEEYEAVAWLHDVLEDCPHITKTDLINEGFPLEVVSAVVVLTRKRNEPYLEYLLRVKRHGGIAVEVKKADVKHNLSTAGKFRHAKIDRWQMAQWILEH
jgi:(p)ppGpp synthase/HD superfamily hydrolase